MNTDENKSKPAAENPKHHTARVSIGFSTNSLGARVVLYSYVDESYIEHAGYWHCTMGGILVSPKDVINAEFALLDVLKAAPTLTPRERLSEFKYSDFFRSQDDDVKIKLLHDLCAALAAFDIRVLISHAHCRTDRLMGLFEIHDSPQKAIQVLACVNTANFLAPFTARGVVQVIIDMGLSEGFKPLYDMYVGSTRGLMATRQMGFDEKHITRHNFRNLPVPLFIESKDSRLIQLSDVAVGLALCQKCAPVSAFKKRMIVAARVLAERTTVHSIEWHANGA